MKIDDDIIENRILITGGSGFIGTNLCENLIKERIEFINLDLNKPKLSNHQSYWKELDIKDENSLIKIFELGS